MGDWLWFDWTCAYLWTITITLSLGLIAGAAGWIVDHFRGPHR